MLLAKDWKDFELLDISAGDKLERWGNFVLQRPDPQVIWPEKGNAKLWEKADAIYHRSESGGGKWEFKKQLPERWTVSYKNLKFYVKTMGFKHTGLFPEQAVNWDFMMDKIKAAKRPINVLNLFAYTGAASVACASAGASVCHVDAAKEIVKRAKENLELSGLADKPVRFITDDVIKFVKREIRRGRKYDGIVMDPPSFGRGPNGELWKLENQLYGLIELCAQVLSDKPIFFLINSYTTGFAPGILENLIKLKVSSKYGGKVTSDALGIPVTSSNLVLPCGIVARWES
ncbi:MAG: class I SAM-dependent methyltransferase [Candidatus Peregrinibacteria bacterium]|nr:class I SAM-dependent methyltransferase [Candidatus Peregrinibacteria bacterium]